MQAIEIETWKSKVPEFVRTTKAFYEGEVNVSEYKGFSGYYGSYAQRGGQANMLRLRMPAGFVTKERMAFVTEMLQKYSVKMLHFTTCQTIQLHHLTGEQAGAIMEEALEAGIITIGSGGDFPRNVMCSPLSGVERGEYFDVAPWAKAASDYLLTLMQGKKLPRKLKVGFSNTPENVTHATFRDLGFVARKDNTFDVYSAGGLGSNPKLGVLVAEQVEPEQIRYYIKAMWQTFCAYGDYVKRTRARSRYMQETLGGADAYRKAFLEELYKVQQWEQELMLCRKEVLTQYGSAVRNPVEQGETDIDIEKAVSSFRIVPQKQTGLYSVLWHPIGGYPSVEVWCQVNDWLQKIHGAELRLTPEQGAYIVNLTAKEAGELLSLTPEGAKNIFETSVSCVGGNVCQVGMRDSAGLLQNCVEAVRHAGIADTALPRMYVSGCPSSCGTHQIGALGFRGGVKRVDGKPEAAFTLFVNGNASEGKECMGKELGTMLERDIPDFLVKLGKEVEASGKSYAEWQSDHPEMLESLANIYIEQ